MIFNEFEGHLKSIGFSLEEVTASNVVYMIIKGVPIGAGSHSGKTCDVGIKRTGENPWVPDTAVHVRPHLVPMGQKNSQASALGPEWQYLSRRFDRPPTPKGFLTHVLTVLGEL